MRLLTQTEKDLIKRIAKFSNGSCLPIPAYKFLLNDIDNADIDKILKKELFSTSPILKIGTSTTETKFENSLISMLIKEIHGKKIRHLFEILKLLNDQGYLRLVKSYRFDTIEVALCNTLQNPQYILITPDDKAILRFIAGYDVELYLPFFLLANNGGQTHEEEVLIHANTTAENSKRTLEEAKSQTKISKWAIGITIVASVISTILSIISICQCS